MSCLKTCLITSTCNICSKSIFFPQVWQCVLTDNLRTANKYSLKRESVDGQHLLALLFKTIIPRLVLWLESTSKGFIIYSRKIKFSYILVAASMLQRNFLCFNIGHQKLVLQSGDTFLITKKVHNPAAWNHMDLNRIQWASNLVKPEKWFNTYLLQNCLPFSGLFYFHYRISCLVSVSCFCHIWFQVLNKYISQILVIIW